MPHQFRPLIAILLAVAAVAGVLAIVVSVGRNPPPLESPPSIVIPSPPGGGTILASPVDTPFGGTPSPTPCTEQLFYEVAFAGTVNGFTITGSALRFGGVEGSVTLTPRIAASLGANVSTSCGDWLGLAQTTIGMTSYSSSFSFTPPLAALDCCDARLVVTYFFVSNNTDVAAFVSDPFKTCCDA